jgi:hypothetical protein
VPPAPGGDTARSVTALLQYGRLIPRDHLAAKVLQVLESYLMAGKRSVQEQLRQVALDKPRPDRRAIAYGVRGEGVAL